MKSPWPVNSSWNRSNEKLFHLICTLNKSCLVASWIKQWLSSRNTLKPFCSNWPTLNKFWSMLGTYNTSVIVLVPECVATTMVPIPLLLKCDLPGPLKFFKASTPWKVFCHKSCDLCIHYQSAKMHLKYNIVGEISCNEKYILLLICNLSIYILLLTLVSTNDCFMPKLIALVALSIRPSPALKWWMT